MVNNELWGKDFFDGGRKEPWYYSSYTCDDLQPLNRLVAWAVCKQFNPSKVLDVGCAKGFLVKAFNDLGIQSYGVDVSNYALTCAPIEIQSYLSRVDLNHESLPFSHGYFDCATFLGTIECLEDHRNILRELHRILQPKSGLYLRTTYKTAPNDTVRKNVHNRNYWLNEFRRYGFKFLPTWSGPLANQWSYGTLLFERI